MWPLTVLIPILILGGQDNWKATLSHKDLAGPLPLTAKIDSLYPTFGMPTKIEHTVGYCGKGPKMVNGEVVEGDTIYCDNLVVYSLDSLTVCTDDLGEIQYYVFTTNKLKTSRGISVGQSRERVLAAYGKPSEADTIYDFSDAQAGEDDSLQYVTEHNPLGIVFFFSHGTVTRIFIGRGSAC